MSSILSSDTICALATPAGGAIAVIRLSGPDAIAIVDRVFRSPSGKPLAEAKANTLHYGEIYGRDDNADVNGHKPNASTAGRRTSGVVEEGLRVIDDVVVAVYRAPHSYTGEDSVEISCHGSRYVIGQILLSLQANGARQAEPGEYTRRAYLNGKMDLSQAEAVADLIASTNRASHDLALGQLRGHVRTALDSMRERLQRLTALLELELDFSDHEDLEFADRGELLDLANDIGNRLRRLADSYRTGRAIKEGIPVAIVGKTNVGKSTLLNRLLGEDRAIVSDVPGTTRDAIEDVMDINGISFRFVDTAGIRQTDDKVERIGIDRAYEQMSKASIILWVVDAEPTSEETEAMEKITDGKRVIVVRNKIDLGDKKVYSSESGVYSSELGVHGSELGVEGPQLEVQSISAKDGTNIDLLKEKIYEAANIPDLNESEAIVSSARQYAILEEALANLTRVIDGLRSGLSSDLIAEDLRLVIGNLGDITGIERVTPATTLDLIFKEFCIGK